MTQTHDLSLIFNKINTTAVTSGSTTAYLTEAHAFTPICTQVRFALKQQYNVL